MITTYLSRFSPEAIGVKMPLAPYKVLSLFQIVLFTKACTAPSLVDFENILPQKRFKTLQPGFYHLYLQRAPRGFVVCKIICFFFKGFGGVYFQETLRLCNPPFYRLGLQKAPRGFVRIIAHNGFSLQFQLSIHCSVLKSNESCEGF